LGEYSNNISYRISEPTVNKKICPIIKKTGKIYAIRKSTIAIPDEIINRLLR